ncbi:T9SS type A sorting domain-containing protein [Flavobacterium sp. NRK F7]|uniref:T9SS type A sorting domain-containing protein n=1 Tax=Flavobacterium sp. NRK F7 TaxID=2954930 RepID=UPI0020916F55|nr:T9SS type A sorting domain-containing protein [Flavobacterium sp. NRK F7]MCO6162035.1 T9SS type A sorting domain-containing protein [Flavobacterium sp. NRK F7]
MKKLYFLSLLLGTSLTFGQSPIITAMIDGPCTGGYPKVCEIYANGTVDFSLYSAQNQTNANTTWGATLDLTPLGTRTDEYVYIIQTGGNTAIATTEFPSITASNSIENAVMNLNGDDRIRIINTATTAVIDQFGVTDVDGTGTSWEWLDTYAIRNNGTGPDAGFTEANWTFGAINLFDTGSGTCTGGTQLQSIVALGTFTLSTKSFNAIDGLKMYPNPLTGNTLNFSSNANAAMTVQVYDVLGKEVVKGNVTNNTFNTGNLKAGIYIVKITEEGKTATRKLVVK